jgi:hypothetical protein
MIDFFFEGQLRLDWGFGNPNFTGAFIAMLMLAAWTFAFFGRWGFWLALVADLALGVCLIYTFSRGSLVALIGGLVPLLHVAFRRRPWRREYCVGVLIVLLTLGGFVWQTRAMHRYAKGIVSEDDSVANRWLIYRVVPRMMWDAPEGWGQGRSGDAFRQWYQPTGRVQRYVHLVSTHATWLVEWGWPLRMAYISGWGFVLAFCAPSKGLGDWRSALVGIWVAFGLAASFSHIAREMWLWAAPTAALLIALSSRIVCRNWLTRRQWLAIPTFAAAALVLMVGWALLSPWQSKVRLRSGVVSVCQSSAAKGEKIGVLWPDHQVLGEFYGQRIRENLAEKTAHPCFYEVLWDDDSHLGSGLDMIVIPGNAATKVTALEASAMKVCRQLTLINPSEPSKELAAALPNVPAVHWITGQMWSGPSRYVWESLLGTRTGVSVNQVPMVGAFVPRWTSSLNIARPPASSAK